MNLLKKLLAIGLLVAVVACGGGGGSPGSAGASTTANNNGTTTITTTATTTTSVAVTASDLLIGFDKTTLANTGADKVVLNVLAVNGLRNALAGVTVTVTVDSDAVFVSQASSTDSNGNYSGLIYSPSNKTNRNVLVTVASGSIIKTATLLVVGGQVNVTSIPGAPSAGQPTTLNFSLKDANGVGIPNQQLVVSGTLGVSTVVSTNINGDASIGLIAPATGGSYSLIVSGGGVTTTRVITVLGSSGSTVVTVPAPTTITASSINANPTNIRPNLTNSQLNKSQITFRMINPQTNSGVENVRVKFMIVAPGLGAGEALSTGGNIVFTDSAGTARTDYIPGVRTSPTNGVQIRACYAADELQLMGSACPSFVDTSLTVSGEALNLSIIENNKLEGLLNNLIYKKTIAIQVADSAGNAVSGAAISASIDITHYGKGLLFASNYPRTVIAGTQTLAGYSITLPPSVGDTYASGTLGNTSSTLPSSIMRVWCVNEDLNRNGVRDVAEDINNNGILDPRASEVVIIPEGNGITDSTGVATFKVQWGQNVATWLAYTVKVTTNVAGSEATNSKSFLTDGLEVDVKNGAFLQPPYGGNSCNIAN